MIQENSSWNSGNTIPKKLTTQPMTKLEKVFLRKNIVAVSFFQNCAIHPYIYLFH